MKKLIISVMLPLLLFVVGCANNATVLMPGWSTYENAEIGYRINYPSTWVVEKDGLAGPTYELSIHPAVAEPFVGYFSILVDPRASMQVIESAYTLSKAGAAEETKITFNGYEAYKFTYSNNPSIVEVYVPYNKQIFLLSTSKYNESDIVKIFESFRFIDQPATGNTVTSTESADDRRNIMANGKVLLSIDDDAIINFFKTKSQLCDVSNSETDSKRKLYCEDKKTFKEMTRFASIVFSPDKLEVGFAIENDIVTPDKVVGIFYPARAVNAVKFLTNFYLGNEFISFSPTGKNFVYQGSCWEGMCGLFVNDSATLVERTSINSPKYLDLLTQKAEFVRWISDNEIEYKLGKELKRASFCITDNDCKLIYSNCDCEAVVSTDPRDSLASNKICIWNVCRGKNVTATCSQSKCNRGDLAQVTTTYLISTANKLKFCNGADMDSAGYKKTITKEIITTTIVSDSLAQTAKNIAVLATDGQCRTALSQLEFKVAGNTVFIPSIDGWAGVSIAMCSCQPEVEANLLRLPGIKQIIWK